MRNCLRRICHYRLHTITVVGPRAELQCATLRIQKTHKSKSKQSQSEDSKTYEWKCGNIEWTDRFEYPRRHVEHVAIVLHYGIHFHRTIKLLIGTRNKLLSDDRDGREHYLLYSRISGVQICALGIRTVWMLPNSPGSQARL